MAIWLDSKYVNLLSVRLRNFKKKDETHWQFSCPICGDSKTDTKKARGYVFPMRTQLVFKCHNCGESMIIPNLIKHIDSVLYEQYMAERYASGQVGRNIPRKNDIVNASPAPLLARTGRKTDTPDLAGAERLSTLPQTNPCVQYVASRKIPVKQYERLYFTEDFAAFVHQHTKLYVDSKIPHDKRLVIPFFDSAGNLTMFQGRSIDPACDKKYRYLTVKLDQENVKIFGAERVNPAKTVYVFEGPLDSLFFDDAVATADASLSKFMNIAPDVVLVFDNEPRNKDLHKQMDTAIQRGAKIVIWDKMNRWKDVNDMVVKGNRTIESIRKEMEENTYSGLELQLKYTQWRKS